MEKGPLDNRISSAIDQDTDIGVVEALFHTANGYLGVRNSPEEGACEGSMRGTYLNAFHELVDIAYGEKLYGFPETKQVIVNAPDAQTMVVEAGDKRFSLFAPEVGGTRQILDMQAGVAIRSSRWTLAPGSELRVEYRRMASFDMPNLFILCCRITSQGYSGSIRICSSLRGDVSNHAANDDPRVASEPLQCLQALEMGIDQGVAFLTAKTFRSALTLCCHVAHQCALNGHWSAHDLLAEEAFTGTLRHGESVELIKYAVYTDSLRCAHPRAEGLKLLKEALARGADSFFAAQGQALADVRERAYVHLDAPNPLPQALSFGLFQLMQSTGYDGVCNVPAKGLSGEGYEGHTFWDSEIYILPFFLWTQPKKAQGMLSYRYAQLDRARANARTLGFSKGALFPWRTINGDECSAYFPAGTAQYHINGDIAYAFLQYWYVTGDTAFMAEKGAEVLVETARLWLELGHMEADGFRIDCVTGPDEYTCLVNNNFYTNAVAQYNLRGAAEIVAALRQHGLDEPLRKKTGVTQDEERAFIEAAGQMHFPKSNGLGVSPQDDSFLQKKKLNWKTLPETDFPLLLHYHPLFLYRHQICKQADTVLAHLLFPETADEATIRRSYHYYDSITTHDSSLSACVFAMMAARLHMEERAVQNFFDTVTLDLMNSHGNTRDGLHTANMGGAYLIMLYGFAGIRAGNGKLSLSPLLPSGWTSYRLPFGYLGRRLSCSVDHRQGAMLELLEGEPLEVLWNGEPRWLENVLRQPMPDRKAFTTGNANPFQAVTF